MSNLVLRVCVWVLGVLATFGNILVIGWRMRYKHTNQVTEAVQSAQQRNTPLIYRQINKVRLFTSRQYVSYQYSYVRIKNNLSSCIRSKNKTINCCSLTR